MTFKKIIFLAIIILISLIYLFKNELLIDYNNLNNIIKATNINIIQIIASLLGGLLSGLVTLLALLITIKHENNIRTDSERLKLMPYLKIKIFKESIKLSYEKINKIYINNTKEPTNFKIYISFENIGLGNIRNLAFFECNNKYRNGLELGVLKIGEFIFLEINICKKDSIIDNNLIIDRIKLAYEDLLGNYYEQYFTIKYGISKGEYYYIDNDLVEDKNYYIPVYYKNKSLAKELKKEIF